MRDAAVLPETRRALFVAVVVAREAEWRISESARVACAMLQTDAGVALCERAGTSWESVSDAIDPEFRRVLDQVHERFRGRGEVFGSAAHIASLGVDSWPLSDEVREALRHAAAGGRPLSPTEVLLALSRADRELEPVLAGLFSEP